MTTSLNSARTEAAWVRRTLIGAALVFMFLFLVLPMRLRAE